jgi:HEAT repeat protein
MQQQCLISVRKLAWQLPLLAGVLLGGCSAADDAAGLPGIEENPAAAGSGLETPVDSPAVAGEKDVPSAGKGPGASAAGSLQLPHAGVLADLVGDDAARRTAARDQLNADPPTDGQLLDVWHKGDLGERRGAAFFAMGIYHGSDARIEDAAIAALKDPDARVRGLSLEMVRHFPRDRFMPLLERMLEMLAAEPDVKNRAMVARLLVSWSTGRDRVQRALADSVLGDPEVQVRSAALVSVYRIADEQPLLELLEKVVRDDPEATLRRLGLNRLGRLGLLAAGTAPLVAARLEDKDEAVSDEAARTLTRLGPAGLGELVKALSSRSIRARRLACYSLGTLGMVARPAVPALEKLLEDPEEDIRELAAMAIRTILLGQ